MPSWQARCRGRQAGAVDAGETLVPGGGGGRGVVGQAWRADFLVSQQHSGRYAARAVFTAGLFDITIVFMHLAAN